MVDKLQVPGLMTLGHQQAVVAELVDPEWRWKREQMMQFVKDSAMQLHGDNDRLGCPTGRSPPPRSIHFAYSDKASYTVGH